uniref:asparagine--tRNA ligase n=1 Tax=viral metagenome TaxID=1070528 RepID=A0A6C0J811_9ZZZZ
MLNQLTVLEFMEYIMPANPTDITISGHIVRLDDRKKIVFGEISDGTTIETVKFIYNGKLKDSSPDIVAFRQASPGASVSLTGHIVEAPLKATQKYELNVHSAVVHSSIRDPASYLYGLKAHKVKTLEEEQKHMVAIRTDLIKRFRDKTFQATLRLRSIIYSSIIDFMVQRGIVNITAPILTDYDCEGAGEMFTATTLTPGHKDYTDDFFKRQMHLSVSGQLYIEAAARELCKGVYTYGRVFRAEHSDTSRHLAEFDMLEVETVYTEINTEDRFNKLMQLQEDIIKHVISVVILHGKDDMNYLSKVLGTSPISVWNKIHETPFSKITYTEAIDHLNKHIKQGGTFKDMNIHFGMDLGSEHERFICENVYNRPTFITHYPQTLKSFYMKGDVNCEPGKKTCQAVDLLVPGVGELCGGSMREDCSKKLIDVINTKGINKDELSWYIDLRQDGGFPTGGFGLGFDRLVSYITGILNVRDVVPFPRCYTK